MNKGNWFKNVISDIEDLIEYYDIPVIDKLGDREKGIHKGRQEGLQLAHKIIVTATVKKLQEIRQTKD